MAPRRPGRKGKAKARFLARNKTAAKRKRAKKAAPLSAPPLRPRKVLGRRKGASAPRLVARPRHEIGNDIYDRDLERNPANFQPLTPLSFLERAAQVFPEHPAIVHARRTHTYAKFYARARRLASALAEARHPQGRHGRGDAGQHAADAGSALWRADDGRGAQRAQHAARSRRRSPSCSIMAKRRC